MEIKKILIIEDDDSLAHALASKLELEGFSVLIVSNGEAALQTITQKQHVFQLVLLDILLPKKDGFMVLRGLRNSNKTLPVIILTNLGHEDELAHAEQLGVSHYFLKADTSLKKLVAHVKKCLKSGV